MAFVFKGVFLLHTVPSGLCLYSSSPIIHSLFVHFLPKVARGSLHKVATCKKGSSLLSWTPSTSWRMRWTTCAGRCVRVAAFCAVQSTHQTAPHCFGSSATYHSPVRKTIENESTSLPSLLIDCLTLLCTLHLSFR